MRIDQDGVAEQGFFIGIMKPKKRNQLVNIDITIETPDGAVYTATTSPCAALPEDVQM